MNREKEIGRDIEERRTRTRRGKNERVVICHGKRPFSQYYFPQSVINCSHISPFSTARLFLFFPFRPVAAPFLFLIVNSTRSFRRLTTAVTRSYLAEISVVGTLWFSTNTKTEGCTSTVKRGIKRKIKRRIALSCIREPVAHTRIFERELIFFTGRVVFASFCLYFRCWRYVRPSKDGRSKAARTKPIRADAFYNLRRRRGK